MNQKCFIKFIIPCWKVGVKIGRMLDSILKQTFTDYHIVCVDDCSPDNTWKVLQTYKSKYSNKITLIKNQINLGAGESRNVGYYQTLNEVPSEYLWIVDADDMIAGPNVLKKVYEYAIKNPHLDIINIGWTFEKEYSVARVGWPIGSWGRVIRTNVYVPAIKKDIKRGNDVYPHFIMFDEVPDEKIGNLDFNCYIYPRSGGTKPSSREMLKKSAYDIGVELMKHGFKKHSVLNALMNSRSNTGKWIKRDFPGFNPKIEHKDRKVSILMASFPYRKKWMLKCIESLIDQCDNFYLWLNEYKEIPDELNKFDKNKLHVTLGDKNIKENGRYVFLMDSRLKDDYCLICDDDIFYPPNYVKNTLDCFARNGDDIVVAYFINYSHDKFAQQFNRDVVGNTHSTFGGVSHYRFGLGVAAFVPSIMNFKFTKDEVYEHYDLEMFLGKQCHDMNVKVISPMRKRGFIKFIPGQEVDRHALHRSGNDVRTRRTYRYMNQRFDKNKVLKQVGVKHENNVLKFMFG